MDECEEKILKGIEQMRSRPICVNCVSMKWGNGGKCRCTRKDCAVVDGNSVCSDFESRFETEDFKRRLEHEKSISSLCAKCVHRGCGRKIGNAGFGCVYRSKATLDDGGKAVCEFFDGLTPGEPVSPKSFEQRVKIASFPICGNCSHSHWDMDGTAQLVYCELDERYVPETDTACERFERKILWEEAFGNPDFRSHKLENCAKTDGEVVMDGCTKAGAED